MKTAVSYLEPMLMDAGVPGGAAYHCDRYGKRDIHDIGKNLVALMLKTTGFRWIDLGKDVPREVIVETAIRHQAEIIALSALMTTMQEMRHVIAYAREQGCKAKINHRRSGDYPRNMRRRSVRTDIPKDAAEAVKLTQRILGL